MATMETAFALQPVAQWIIASQSVVPIGFSYNKKRDFDHPTGPVWPYQEMIESLLSDPSYATAVLDSLATFFDSVAANRFPSDAVSFALLNCAVGTDLDTLASPFKDFIVGLNSLQCKERWALLNGTQITPVFRHTDLIAGEWALIDLVALCNRLIANPPAASLAVNQELSGQITSAATALLSAITGAAGTPPFVKKVFESPSSAGSSLGCGGVGAMWLPGTTAPAGDEFISGQIDPTYYGGLAFITMTAPAGQNDWCVLAFEHKTTCP